MYYFIRSDCRKRQSDPEVLTYDQDWTVHVKELIERREDGLCMDTISRSAKLRRKSMIPGEPELVLQSVTTIRTPGTSPKKNPKDKQVGVKDTANDASCHDQEIRNSPKAEHRTEYTWEKLLPLSGGKIKRSHTFHYNLSEYRTPVRSLNFEGEPQVQLDASRSKSLRGYKYCGSSTSQAFLANEPLPPTEMVISVKHGNGQRKRQGFEKRSRVDQSHSKVAVATAGDASADNNKRQLNRSRSAPSTRAKEKVVKRGEAEDGSRERSKSLRWIPEPDYQSVSIEELVKCGEKGDENDNPEDSFEHRQPNNTESTEATRMKRANFNDANKQVSRSGSAPSIEAKERVVRHEAEEPSRQRSVSLHWIPEPDYQAVSVGDLVSATQTCVEGTRSENNVCIVEIHNPPKNCEKKVVKPVDTSEIGGGRGDITTPHQNQHRKTSGGYVSKFPVPGVAQKILARSSIGDDRSQEQDGTETANKEETLSVKNRIQNFEGQILPGRITSVSNKCSPAETTYGDEAVKVASVKSDTNSRPKSMLNTNATPPANVGMDELKIDNGPTVLPSQINKQPEVRAIGKMKIVKNEDAPVWLVNQERTLQRPIRENPAGLPSTKTNPHDDQSSKADAPLIHSKTEVTPASTSELVKAALRNKNKINTIDNNNNLLNVEEENKLTSFSSSLSTEVKASTLPTKDIMKGTSISVGQEVDTPSLEEKKKNWKREQIVDQLHTARQRNSSQNYIFGTGLAYQSCMPELQNKLKQLTLGK